MKRFLRKTLICFIVAMLLVPTWTITGLMRIEQAKAAATTLVEWNFPNNPDDAVADGGVAANLSKTISVVGANSPTFGAAGAASYAATATGWDSGQDSKFWQIDFDATGFQSINVSSKQYSSTTGPRDFKLQYRIGVLGTWTDIIGADVTVASNFVSGQLNNVTLPTVLDYQPAVYLRWIMTSNVSVSGGTVSSSGTNRIDDIVVSGQAGSLPVAPVLNSLTTPINNARPTLSWNPVTSVPSVDSYKVTIDFDPPVVVLAPATNYIPASALTEGDHTWSVSAHNIIGDGPNSGVEIFNIDTVSPLAPIITATDSVTASNETNFSITGTGEANGTVDYLISDSGVGTVSGKSVVDPSGNINITGIDVSALANGGLTVSATITDAAGNVSPAGVYSTVKNTVRMIILATPVITVSGMMENSDRYIKVDWQGVGGGVEKYQIFINGVANDLSTITVIGDDTGRAYSQKIKVLNDGQYEIFVKAVRGTEFVVSSAKIIEFVTPAPVVQPASSVRSSTSVAPAPVQAQTPVTAQPQVQPAPNGDDQGVIKGDETQNATAEKINWTPWIILFVLILLTGAATGGYFYWFSGDEEVETTVKLTKTAAAVKEKPKTRSGAKIVDKKPDRKSKRW